jgi:tight adherence protein B
MSLALLASLGGAAVLLIALALRRARLRERVAARLRAEPGADAPGATHASLRDPRGFEAPLGFGVAALAAALLGASAFVASGVGMLAAVAVQIALEWRISRRRIAIEEGLAEVVGGVASMVRVGASPLDALVRNAAECREPLHSLLGDLTGRLRLGEDPALALRRLSESAPIHSTRLLAVALGVQWSGGGSLGPSLDAIARSIRERAQLARRIDTQAASTRGSIAVLLGATGAVAWLSWSNDSANLAAFLASPAGGALLALVLWLQALALLWMWRLVRPPRG